MNLLTLEEWELHKQTSPHPALDGVETLTMDGYLSLPGMSNFTPSDAMCEAAAGIEETLGKNFPGLDIQGVEVRHQNPASTQERWNAHISGHNGGVVLLSWEMYLRGPKIYRRSLYNTDNSQVLRDNIWQKVEFFGHFPGGMYREATGRAITALVPFIDGFAMYMSGPGIALATDKTLTASGLDALSLLKIPVEKYQVSAAIL